jgi:hypothetical protein
MGRFCVPCQSEPKQFTMQDMSTEPTQPTRQAIAAQNRSLPGRVTGRLLVAVNAMVWQAASRKEAAEMAGMSDHSLRAALKRRHVMDHYLSECEVLRLSGRAKRLHRLEQLAMQDTNKNAAVAAIKTAEGLGDEADARPGGRTGALQPGLQILIYSPPTRENVTPPRTIDAAASSEPAPRTLDAEPALIPVPYANQPDERAEPPVSRDPIFRHPLYC